MEVCGALAEVQGMCLEGKALKKHFLKHENELDEDVSECQA